MYVTPQKAKQHFRVTDDTLRRWQKQGKIKTKRTQGGHRRYFIPSQQDTSNKQSIIYTRVSSKKQSNVKSLEKI